MMVGRGGPFPCPCQSWCSTAGVKVGTLRVRRLRQQARDAVAALPYFAPTFLTPPPFPHLTPFAPHQSGRYQGKGEPCVKPNEARHTQQITSSSTLYSLHY